MEVTNGLVTICPWRFYVLLSDGDSVCVDNTGEPTIYYDDAPWVGTVADAHTEADHRLELYEEQYGEAAGVMLESHDALKISTSPEKAAPLRDYQNALKKKAFARLVGSERFKRWLKNEIGESGALKISTSPEKLAPLRDYQNSLRRGLPERDDRVGWRASLLATAWLVGSLAFLALVLWRRWS